VAGLWVGEVGVDGAGGTNDCIHYVRGTNRSKGGPYCTGALSTV